MAYGPSAMGLRRKGGACCITTSSTFTATTCHACDRRSGLTPYAPIRFAGNVLGPLAGASSPKRLVGPMCVLLAFVLLPPSRLRRSVARRTQARRGATRQQYSWFPSRPGGSDTLAMICPENWGLLLANSRLRRSLPNSKSPQLFSRARSITH